ncbi:hypothetical protein BDK51DRAFT_43773 [Blyttiomyces helicus]|uniref:Uncharacterized protein n=1 Tax=Blyttiomyces helicus TaxID=388810 RepID=A0A4P9W7C1_9FUNG|nr:hypothetical protein BDK51DRAFT_43773 [Blyttiomyces helicus]|eukprot:RKO87275.1 hypothetical protein BDK51DRAFT_43773 [Blyttiomyces helicus]
MKLVAAGAQEMHGWAKPSAIHAAWQMDLIADDSIASDAALGRCLFILCIAPLSYNPKSAARTPAFGLTGFGGGGIGSAAMPAGDPAFIDMSVFGGGGGYASPSPLPSQRLRQSPRHPTTPPSTKLRAPLALNSNIDRASSLASAAAPTAIAVRPVCERHVRMSAPEGSIFGSGDAESPIANSRHVPTSPTSRIPSRKAASRAGQPGPHPTDQPTSLASTNDELAADLSFVVLHVMRKLRNGSIDKAVIHDLVLYLLEKIEVDLACCPSGGGPRQSGRAGREAREGKRAWTPMSRRFVVNKARACGHFTADSARGADLSGAAQRA